MKVLPFSEYQQVEAVNWSTLKELRKSPLHYRHRLQHPREDTTRFALGRGAHTAILEPDKFMLEYACFKGPTRRGKKWDEFKSQHGDETILKRDEYELCLAMRDAVRASPVAAEYLRSGVAEVSLMWTDPVTGLSCKARPDWVSKSKPALVDVKTTGDVSANRFATTTARMGYHCQAAFYQAGYAVAHGTLLPFITIAVEAEPPHDVAVYRLDDDALYAGEQEYMRLLAMVRECRAGETWPGRFAEEQILRLPSWAVHDDEEDVGGLDLMVNGQSTGV